MSRLIAEHLAKSYKQRQVVKDVSLSVESGQVIGLLGPNGAGKTTTFYMIVGLINSDKGRIVLDDTDITLLPMHERARRGIGYLPQESSIFRKLSVRDNIMAILEMKEMTKAERKDKVDQMIEEFSLQKVRKNSAMSLSAGGRRGTEIARALAVDPKFVLLDEPFAGVDPIAVEEIQSIVTKLRKKNIGILITDHNVDETLSITDRAYLMVDGKLFKSGTAEDLANDPQVRKVYLGQNFELRRAKINTEDH